MLAVRLTDGTNQRDINVPAEAEAALIKALRREIGAGDPDIPDLAIVARWLRDTWATRVHHEMRQEAMNAVEPIQIP